jgi:NADH-quinone oxidoreductase subunit H
MTLSLLAIQLDWALVIEKFVLIVVVVLVSLGFAMYSTWGERKVAAALQDRPGPNRAGWFGLLQPVADAVKLFSKEDIIPSRANKILFVMGPGLAMLAALMTSAVIPWGGTITIAGREISLQIADINIGMLYIFAVVALGVYGVMIGGWSSNNKFSLLAAIRGASQNISYELAMGLSIIALVFVTGSLSLKDIVVGQQENGWNIIYQPLGFLIFITCAFAECNRTPFDLPEAENELNFGYHQEYSSMKLGFYLFSEYINMFISSIIMATLYFGGYDILPFVDESKWGLHPNLLAALGVVSLLTKGVLFVLFFMWIRWTIPRFRYDQLMNLGWKKLIPLALFNMLVSAAVVLYLQNGWPK